MNIKPIDYTNRGYNNITLLGLLNDNPIGGKTTGVTVNITVTIIKNKEIFQDDVLPVICYGKLAELALNHLSIGKRVLAEGYIKLIDGKLSIIATEITLLSPATKQEK